jgi:hypothetical protein
MNLDSGVHTIRIERVLKIAVQGRRVRFDMLTDSRILKGAVFSINHLRPRQYANQWSHKYG